MFNNTTIILIVILLLIIYLFDNIKDLEDKVLSNKYIKNIFVTDYYKPRRKYFKDLHYKSPIFLPGVPDPQSPKNELVLPAVLPTHTPSQLFIKPEKKVVIPSEDKFISGAKSTTIVKNNNNNNNELSPNVNDVDEPFYN